MERRNHELPARRVAVEADMAVAVAERGLESWRAAKAAWLDSFAAFVVQESANAPTTSRITQSAR